MPRPGFVLEVDDKTPALLTMAGAAVRLQSFAAGTRVAYPADAVPSSNPVALIDAALDSPVEGGSLGESKPRKKVETTKIKQRATHVYP